MTEDEPASVPADDAETRAADLQRRLVELETQSRERLIRSELKAEAVRAGMVDLDGLKLVDAGGLSIDETGEVQGAAALMQSVCWAKIEAMNSHWIKSKTWTLIIKRLWKNAR